MVHAQVFQAESRSFLISSPPPLKGQKFPPLSLYSLTSQGPPGRKGRSCSRICSQWPALCAGAGPRVEPTGVKLWSRQKKASQRPHPQTPAVGGVGGGGLGLPARPNPPRKLRVSAPPGTCKGPLEKGEGPSFTAGEPAPHPRINLGHISRSLVPSSGGEASCRVLRGGFFFF